MITVQQPAGLRSFLLQIDGMREEGVTAERTPEKPMRLRGEMVCVREHLISFDHHPPSECASPFNYPSVCRSASVLHDAEECSGERSDIWDGQDSHSVNEVQLI